MPYMPGWGAAQAPALALALGSNVIVENKPGASGALAGETTTGAPPDGSTLFFAANPTITIVPHNPEEDALDRRRDLTPAGPVAEHANVLVVLLQRRATGRQAARSVPCGAR